MERRKLSPEEVTEKLKTLNGWRVENDALVRKFAFANFAGALEFVNRVGAVAEAADHHPDIKFGWGYAEFAITTHDRGGITDFDLALARELENLDREPDR